MHVTHIARRLGPTLTDVILPDGTNVNHTLVKDGWCWWYRKYAPGDTVLEGLENEAHEGGIGLWADPQPVPPWEWRMRKPVNGAQESGSFRSHGG
jgi:micrococcal nuclease